MSASLLAAKFAQALALHQQGQLARAQALYREVIAEAPRYFDALHLLGVVTVQAGDVEAGLRWIGKALAVDPNCAEALCNQGLALQQLGRMKAALSSFDKAVALKADYALAYYHRGNVLRVLGQPKAALASYERAVDLQPEFAIAHFNCGVLLQEQQRWEAALASYERAVSLKPDYAAAHLNRGLVLQRLGQSVAAIASYDRAITIDAGFVLAYCNRGVALQDLKQWEGALASYEQALALAPDRADVYLSRGDVLQQLGRWESALASYERALGLKPDYADAWCNRGNALLAMHRMEEALASFDRAIALNPEVPEIHFNKSMALLLTGDFENGWLQYEWRLKRQGRGQRDFAQPPWLGREDLAGKTILLHAEQGLGDTLQFCRYASLVARLGARVVLAVQEPLANLLCGLDGIAQVLHPGEQLPQFDYHCPLPSLPLAFKTSLTTIPSSDRYLKSEPGKLAQWRARLGERTAPRIGLAWRGNPKRPLDQARSFSLSDWIEHLPGGVHYVSLQKEPSEADRGVLRSNPAVLNLGPGLDDFTDTAAVCDCLDAVLSVDTSVAHLSAALGRTTWILLPFNADWRWLLDRDDSPWYSAARLYRQKTLGVWRDVFEGVAMDLIAKFNPASAIPAAIRT
jgi:tetratricopeptide (TPR) repeat protein